MRGDVVASVVGFLIGGLLIGPFAAYLWYRWWVGKTNGGEEQ